MYDFFRRCWRRPQNDSNVAFPTQQLFVLGMYQIAPRVMTLVDLINSTMSNMRTDCVHVNIPLHLLHDSIIRDYPG